MATMTIDNTNNLWVLEERATGSGTFTDLITTENKFVDKNISVKITIPAAGNKSLAIADKATSTITPEEVNTSGVGSGYYPLKTSLTGTMTFSNAGWVTSAGQEATDGDVIVGRIAQSTLASGTSATANYTNTITVTPSSTANTYINIEPGYNTGRYVTIAPMSSGTKAAGAVTISGTATKPTLANTASSINGKTQVTISNITEAQNDITSTYYIALTADAPETTPTFSRSVTTAGYLGPVGLTEQISASGKINHKSQLFYAPLTSGAITITGSGTATAPTLTKYTTDGSNAGTNISAIVGTISTTEPSDTGSYYVAFTAKAPGTTITMSKTIDTAGWIGNASQITASGSLSENSQIFYAPITAGKLNHVSSEADASSGNITLGAKTTTRPSSGKYIEVTGRGTIKVGTAGYLPLNTQLTSTLTTAFYPIADATFDITDNVVKSTGAGWVDANVNIATLSAGSLANTATSGQTYAEVTSPAIDTSNGFLYINKGYFANTKISLATLIPDSATTDVVSSAMLPNYEAFDTLGRRIVGGMTIYDGSYTSTWS